MPTAIRVPDLGTVSSEMILRIWHKSEGDPVLAGEALCELESDKASSDLESVAEGVILRRVVREGSRVEAGDVIAYIGKQGDSIEEDSHAAVSVERATASNSPADASGRRDRSPASPMIAGLARRLGLDLNRVRGTGPGGRVTRADLMEAEKARMGTLDPVPSPRGGPLSRNQLGVARAVATSARESVPISLWSSIRMERAWALRQEGRGGRRISYDAMFVFAMARAARRNPSFASYYENDAVVIADGIHVALAASNEKGLFLPVIRNADRKPLEELEAEVLALKRTSEGGEFSFEGLGGATMTVTNLGMFPVDSFTAVIPRRQCAILSVGRAREVVGFRENHVVVDRIAQVVLTVDHRLINGREAAELISRTAEELEGL